MKKNFKISKKSGGWWEGDYTNLRFEAKVFSERTNYGINGGRVSKLWVTTNDGTLINYDRGWDLGEHLETVWRPLVSLIEKQVPAQK